MRITIVGSVNMRIRIKRGSLRKSFYLPHQKKRSCRLAWPNDSEGNYETLPLPGVSYFPEMWDHGPTLAEAAPPSTWQDAFACASRFPEEQHLELPSDESILESIDTSLQRRLQAYKTQSQAARSMASLAEGLPIIPDPWSPTLPTTEEINTLAFFSLPSSQLSWKAGRPGGFTKVILRPFA